ncbi:(2Fe-2S)-binding protein [Phaeovulum vinaykumarii]|uniref:BFD-like [2Fe-2S] binding domain-containing protein n=1 Tax=Phaeovulum vinaykumarii TaxID=407234 RepID=A0A1N7M7Z8_9RHOB|nr:(2Fe-2S)-binding protein [Phaeovulum vinaykumarii]SIS82172.1 BFD-like [2Fe-2S] binding domain-containing protein [Phaeovulum vinaykumarii]SOC11154.1 BFD-like [2Fe-2S] binding protein [Phaeovulum vinaykumarii]
MIVCHCMGITDHDIRAAVDWMRAADPDTLITPGKIYRALGKTADCGSCMPLFLDTMHRCENLGVDPGARSGPPIFKEISHARRPQGHRISQRGPAL